LRGFEIIPENGNNLLDLLILILVHKEFEDFRAKVTEIYFTFLVKALEQQVSRSL
jgi:hypothetical protein